MANKSGFFYALLYFSKVKDLTKLSIKAWAEDDRPREKLMLKGRQSLSDAELIAILLGSGNREQTAVELAQLILHTHDNNLGVVAKKSVKDLMKFKGIGEAKAISIISALELGRRRKEGKVETKPKIKSSKDAYSVIYGELADIPMEEFWVVLLNQNNRVLSKQFISRGGISGTIADSRIIFKYALDHLATSIILCHNHPSGNVSPSVQDKELTKRMVSAGDLLQIKVLDHIIVGDEDYFSFADEGIL